MIDIIKALAGMPVSRARFIALSAARLLNAGMLANNSQACSAEAKRIYKRRCGGMWKKVQADARNAIRTASLYGLTLERPYVLWSGGLGSPARGRMMYTLGLDGNLQPTCWIGPKK